MSYDEDWINKIIKELEQCPIGSPVADRAKRMIEAANNGKSPANVTYVGWRDTVWPYPYPKVTCSNDATKR